MQINSVIRRSSDERAFYCEKNINYKNIKYENINDKKEVS